MGPRIGIADGVAGIDLEDGIECSIVDAEAYSLIVRFDHMDAASLALLLRGVRGSRICSRNLNRIRCLCKFREPRTNPTQRPHKPACSHQPPPSLTTHSQ